MRAGHVALAALTGFAAGVIAFGLGHSLWMSLLIYSATGLGVFAAALIVTFGGGMMASALSRPPAVRYSPVTVPATVSAAVPIGK